jgi:hypothetical protein
MKNKYLRIKIPAIIVFDNPINSIADPSLGVAG